MTQKQRKAYWTKKAKAQLAEQKKKPSKKKPPKKKPPAVQPVPTFEPGSPASPWVS
jgi:hypothetical protein